MCGIAGIVSKQGKVMHEPVRKMTETLRHRGPDDSGVISMDNCILGHTRLSIVDLEHGQQPMQTPDQTITITFNGEIYGYKALRDQLHYNYITTSDTEVLLATYKQYGHKMLDHVNGMFAFGIWDQKENTLFAARDRFGEKPFFYSFTEKGDFIFASEIKAILSSGLVKPEIDRKSLAHYFRHLYIHPGTTIFKNIKPLPPAHYLSLVDGKLSVQRYWTPGREKIEISIEDATVELGRLLHRSVQKQLIADVPVGAFLSGGLDSGTIVSFAAALNKNLKTYSFGFLEGENELQPARELSRLYHTDHHEFNDQNLDVGELLLEMSSIFDEPFADSSNVPTFLISKAASDHQKVVLTGDGGDELLGGYDFWYRKLLDPPFFLSKGIMRPYYLELVKSSFKLSGKIRRRYEKEYAEYTQYKKGRWVSDQHQMSNVYFGDEDLNSIGLDKVDNMYTFSNGFNSNIVDDAMLMDLENYMPGDILTKTDRASMANGLELRSPFLDKDVAEFCISLPSHLKIDKHESKILLRKLAKDRLPNKHFDMKKTGFGAPVDVWLKDKKVIELKEQLIYSNSSSINGLLNSDGVRSLTSSDNYKTWSLIVFGLWAEKWL